MARDRVVVFRLSQEEYRSLKEACDSCGARNFSDFTRSGLLASLLPAGGVPNHVQTRFATLEQQLTELQGAVTHLIQLLERAINPDKSGARPPEDDPDPLRVCST